MQIKPENLLSPESLLKTQKIAQAFKNACMSELQAIKPGNVHVFADGHGMVVQDFIKSADVTALVIAQANLSVGERILKSIKATQQAVACNTNLGIVLLCAVIVEAALAGNELALKFAVKSALKEKIATVLKQLTVADAQLAFAAITIAKPAGLGASSLHDVNNSAEVSLLDAMRAAQHRDLIALQYANGFDDIFELGLISYKAAMTQWHNTIWATTFVYLNFLAQFADSHIVRKFGQILAHQVQQEAQQHLNALMRLDNPKLYLRTLMIWDADLKQRGINPGTSADLTVATCLVVECEAMAQASG